jgi:hypothetical protein
MNRLAMLVLFLSILAGTGCQRRIETKASDEKTTQQLDDLSRKVDELKTLLAEMKQGTPGSERECRAWLHDNLTPGQTTLADVERIFGNSYLDLDRPDRDNVVTVQYSLDEVHGKKLVLDFSREKSPRTPIFGEPFLAPGSSTPHNSLVLEKPPEIQLWICGYCPHVLVNSNGWHLDGKMLAGAIGASRERSDTLPLPRAKIDQGAIKVKLANWAPEIEYLEQMELGFIEAQSDEQMDCDANGGTLLWCEEQALTCAKPETTDGRDRWRMTPDCARRRPTVLVLELRNTEQFQKFASECYRRGEAPIADLHVDGARPLAISPIGTKFFRRVVVPLEGDLSEVRLSSPTGLWWVRRAWLGQGRKVSPKWMSPSQKDAAAALLRSRDGNRLRLDPNEEAEFTFPLSGENGCSSNLRFALRVTGYYEFIPER